MSGQAAPERELALEPTGVRILIDNAGDEPREPLRLRVSRDQRIVMARHEVLPPGRERGPFADKTLVIAVTTQPGAGPEEIEHVYRVEDFRDHAKEEFGDGEHEISPKFDLRGTEGTCAFGPRGRVGDTEWRGPDSFAEHQVAGLAGQAVARLAPVLPVHAVGIGAVWRVYEVAPPQRVITYRLVERDEAGFVLAGDVESLATMTIDAKGAPADAQYHPPPASTLIKWRFAEPLPYEASWIPQWPGEEPPFGLMILGYAIEPRD